MSHDTPVLRALAESGIEHMVTRRRRVRSLAEAGEARGYAGQFAGGVLKKGDDVIVLPSGMTSTIEGIDLFDKKIDEAFPPMSVTVRLADDVDVSRGDMIAPPRTPPPPARTSTR